MQKKISLLIGMTLILLGLLALAGNLVIQAAGGGSLLGLGAWPVLVVGAGLLFCLPPFLFPRQRGLSGLFIPGIPVLITGILLFIASVTGDWAIWGTWWPLEVLSLAAAFLLMAIFLKVPWLTIPGSILGFTGLVLQLCALTGQWSWWALLWTVIPFAVGLPLLLIGFARKLEGVRLAGIILCGLAVLAFAAMSAIVVTSMWITRMIGPALVLVLGVLLVIMALGRRPPAQVPEKVEAPMETPVEEPPAAPPGEQST